LANPGLDSRFTEGGEVVNSSAGSALFRRNVYFLSLSGITDPEVLVQFTALPHFLRSSGLLSGLYESYNDNPHKSGDPLSPVSTTEELLGRKSSGFCLESREYGHRDPFFMYRSCFYGVESSKGIFVLQY
jgi:hypothetical protein